MIDVPISLVCAECGAELHGEVNPLGYKTVVKVTPCRCVIPDCRDCGKPLCEDDRCEACNAGTAEQKEDWLG